MNPIINTDPEAEIEQMINELAYKRVKESYLFNVLSNAEADAKANELSERIAAEFEAWLFREVNAEAEHQNELDAFVADARRY